MPGMPGRVGEKGEKGFMGSRGVPGDAKEGTPGPQGMPGKIMNMLMNLDSKSALYIYCMSLTQNILSIFSFPFYYIKGCLN